MTERAEKIKRSIYKALDALLARGMTLDDAVEEINGWLRPITKDGWIVLTYDHERSIVFVDVEGWSKDPDGILGRAAREGRRDG